MKKEKPTAAPEGKKEKTRYQMIIDGDKEPEGKEKGYINLVEGQTLHNFRNKTPEELKAISRKGAEAVNRLHGKQKTAKEALQGILTLKATPEIMEASDAPPEVIEKLRRDNPDATIYDLLQAVAVGRAARGNIAAMQYVRDTAGDKPQDKVEISNNIMTDQDRELMQQISDRLKAAEICIVDDHGSD